MEIILRAPVLSATALKIGRRAVSVTPVSAVSDVLPASLASFSREKPIPVAPEETTREEDALRLRLKQELRAELERELRLEMNQDLQLEAERKAIQSRTEAERKGYAEGFEKAQAEARAGLQAQVSRLQSVGTSLGAARSDLIATTEDDLIALVFAAVTRIIGSQALSRDFIIGMAEQAIAERSLPGKLTILLHPQDHALIHAAPGNMDSLNTEGGTKSNGVAVDWKADRTVKVGGCAIECASGTLDARLDIQLDLLRKHLLSIRMKRSSAPSLATPTAPRQMGESS